MSAGIPGARPRRPVVTVYSRRGCHLCELLLEDLVPLCHGRAEVEVLDVDRDPSWRQAYGERIPVVCIGNREICAVELDAAALMAALEDGAAGNAGA